MYFDSLICSKNAMLVGCGYEALRFYKILCFFGNLSLRASYAMLMRPKKAKTAIHGC